MDEEQKLLADVHVARQQWFLSKAAASRGCRLTMRQIVEMHNWLTFIKKKKEV